MYVKISDIKTELDLALVLEEFERYATGIKRKKVRFNKDNLKKTITTLKKGYLQLTYKERYDRLFHGDVRVNYKFSFKTFSLERLNINYGKKLSIKRLHANKLLRLQNDILKAEKLVVGARDDLAKFSLRSVNSVCL